MERAPVIDALQYAAWSEAVFREMRAGGVDAVHATIAYHEGFREAVANLCDWRRRFEAHPDLIAPAACGDDIRRAMETGRTAILLGFQTPAPIEADIDLLGVWKSLGLAAMQLTYNTHSLLGAGCYEEADAGLTRMGHEAVAEMNRLGIAIDLSHAGPRTAMEAIETSARPVAATHANPKHWRDVPRNLSDDLLGALAETGGMLGLSLYPHHLAGGPDCTLAEFCRMVAGLAERWGTGWIGLGSDLVQGQPDSVVAWMRNGRWSRARPEAAFPPELAWFRGNRDFPGIARGLRETGFSEREVAAIMGGNWMRFFDAALEPAA